MDTKPNTSTDTKEESKLKYVQVVPHQYCPGNFVILEILPQPADENNNSVVPETTANKRVTEKKPKITRGINPNRLTNTRRRNIYNEVIKTLKIQKSPLWDIYKNRRKLLSWRER